MALLEIVKFPDPRLSMPCLPVGDRVSEYRALIENMFETMFAEEGAGLAAPQVAQPVRIFIIDPVIAALGESALPMVFVDPEIVSLHGELELSDEGCLSFPGVFVPIKRYFKCRMRAHDSEGELFEVEGEALFARAMQHENDHLNGKLLTDHVGRLKRQMIARRIAREGAAQ